MVGEQKLKDGLSRASITCSVSVLITMPSVAGVTQDANSLLVPSSSTTHILHEPKGMRSLWSQKVGISTSTFRAASRMEAPESTSAFFPSMVRLIFMIIYSFTTASNLQTSKQTLHLVQRLWSITCSSFLSPVMAPTGHFLAHTVHPVQASLMP